MAPRGEGRPSGVGYFLRFMGTALLLVAATLVLVLVVLPQRYVLSAGFRESSLTFPTPGTPFAPPRTVRVPARRLAVSSPSGTAAGRGPAEDFWDRVLPPLKSGRFDDALPLFVAYLGQYPSDHDARREYGIALVRAGRAGDAAHVQKNLLADTRDPGDRLRLARTLRDLGRADEASEHYYALSRAAPADIDLILEWSRAFSATSRYVTAENILRDALRRHGSSASLRVELARIRYYTDGLAEADEILSSVPESDLDALGARALRDDVAAARVVPGDSERNTAPLSLLEQAVAEREKDDFESAAGLFREALETDPTAAPVWRAYADLLQYELADLAGAHEALVTVQALTDGSPDLQMRLAQLEIWLGRPAEAEARLLAMLVDPETDEGKAACCGNLPDARVMLGNLYRWDGRRRPAAEQYRLALAEVPDHERAREGMSQLRLDLFLGTVESQRPRVGVTASSLSDTDGFHRWEASSEWAGISDTWTWAVRAGVRSVHGSDLQGAAATERGRFADSEVGRWWRWGTLRTALRLGVEDLRADGAQVLLAASVRLLDPSGRRTDVSLGLEPAHMRTNTLQSIRGGLIERRVAVSHAHPLADRWILSTSVEGASLEAAPAMGTDAGVRWQGSLSVGRVVTPSVTVGLSTGATGFTRPAPRPSGSRLYWDPRSALSFGPYARVTHAIDDRWSVSGAFQTGLARLHERSPFDASLVPHLSAEGGVAREGGRYRAAMDAFFLQGRFDGYRAYGLTLSFGARTGASRRSAR